MSDYERCPLTGGDQNGGSTAYICQVKLHPRGLLSIQNGYERRPANTRSCIIKIGDFEFVQNGDKCAIG